MVITLQLMSHYKQDNKVQLWGVSKGDELEEKSIII